MACFKVDHKVSNDDCVIFLTCITFTLLSVSPSLSLCYIGSRESRLVALRRCHHNQIDDLEIKSLNIFKTNFKNQIESLNDL